MTEESFNPKNVHMNGWRLSKDVPLSLLALFVLQTLTFTWFLAGQNGKLSQVIEEVQASKNAAYTKDDAHKEREFQEQKYLLLQTKDEEMLRRITLLEAQVNDLRVRAASK